MVNARNGPKHTVLFRVVRLLDRAYRKVHRHPVFHALVPSKRSLALFFLILVPLVALNVYIVKRTQTPRLFLTGPHASTASLLGPSFVEVLNSAAGLKQWFFQYLIEDFSAVETCGSLDNIAILNQGKAQLAFVEDGLPLHVKTPPACQLPVDRRLGGNVVPSGTVRLQAVMPLYLGPLHVIAKRGLNYTDVRHIKPHSKVYIGPDGSGTSFVSLLVLRHEGIPIDRIGANWDFQRAMQAILKGEIDVAFFLIALNSQEIKQLLDSPALHLLTVDSAEALTLLAPYLEMAKIPASTYKVSSTEITTVATKTILAASTELSDAEVYEIATRLSHHLHDLLKDIPLNATKTINGTVDLYYPLHHGAVRFYNHDPPFFLDPHLLAGLGSYLSLLYACYALAGQWLRHYRLHRLLQVVDRFLRISRRTGQKPGTGSTERYLADIRMRMARLLREGRIKMDDIGVVNEYLRSHS
jgi:TRAP-type uncharacterized transport system substrate-binding protein